MMEIHVYDKIKVQDGRIGLVFAVADKEQRVMVVFDEHKESEKEYPLVSDGLFDGAVSVPMQDVLSVMA